MTLPNTKKTLQTVKIVSEAENPPSVELIAEEIKKVSEAMTKLLASRLTKRAITVLIRDSMTAPAMGFKDIETVLDCTAKLGHRYLK